MAKTQRRLWCDMDGVVAVYSKDAFSGNYEDNAPDHEKPRFLKEPHYFAACTPDLRIISILRILTYHDFDVHMISNVIPSAIAREHERGKQIWLRTYMPFIDTASHFHAIQQPKVDYVKGYLHRFTLTPTLTPNEILISDFNDDLLPWDACGGQGIKYLNGINSGESYSGLKLSPKMDLDAIYQLFDIP